MTDDPDGGTGPRLRPEAAQRVRFEAMLRLIAELDRATARGEAAPMEVLAQLDASLQAASIEFWVRVDLLLRGGEVEGEPGQLGAGAALWLRAGTL